MTDSGFKARLNNGVGEEVVPVSNEEFDSRYVKHYGIARRSGRYLPVGIR